MYITDVDTVLRVVRDAIEEQERYDHWDWQYCFVGQVHHAVTGVPHEDATDQQIAAPRPHSAYAQAVGEIARRLGWLPVDRGLSGYAETVESDQACYISKLIDQEHRLVTFTSREAVLNVLGRAEAAAA